MNADESQFEHAKSHKLQIFRLTKVAGKKLADHSIRNLIDAVGKRKAANGSTSLVFIGDSTMRFVFMYAKITEDYPLHHLGTK